MQVRSLQQSFNGGVMSPEMYGRVEDPKYKSGLAVAKNFLIDPRGAAVSRPGFAYVNKAKYPGKACRLIPFQYSTDQTMVLEFGEYYVRFHTQGQTLVDEDGEPYEVETPYTAGDLFDIHYVQSADVLTLVHTAYPPAELKRYDTLDWVYEAIVFNEALDSPDAPTVVQTINEDVDNPTDYVREYAVTALLSDGTCESTRSESTSIDCNPYGTGAYNTITWNAVDGAEIYRVYRNQGGIWCFIGQTETTSIIDENIDPDASVTPPMYDADLFVDAGGITSVTLTNGGSGYGETGVIEDVDDDSDNIIIYPVHVSVGVDDTLTVSFDADDIVRVTKYTSAGNPKKYTTTSGSGAVLSGTIKIYLVEDRSTTAAVASCDVTSGGSGYSEEDYIRIETTYTDYDYSDTESGGTAVSSTVVVWVPLVISSSSVTLTVTDETGSDAVLKAKVTDGVITGVTVVSAGQDYTDPVITAEDSSGTGSGAEFECEIADAGDYPGAVTYFEQRRWFGGTEAKPNNIWATRSGTESDMSYNLPVQDDSRIAVRVAAREANRIEHFVPLSQLILLTASTEWRVSPLNSDAITPSSMSVRPQSYVGANGVQPVVVNNAIIYASARGGHLRELGYSYNAGGYISNDLCLRANHLFDGLDIVDMAFGKAPWQQVYAISSDGTMISMTYEPIQQVCAFSTIETAGTFESCAVVPEGTDDILYVVVLREINGETTRYIERMHERQFTEMSAWCASDSFGTYSGDETTSVSGLDWLEGMEVSILADGAVVPNQTVTDGTITLDYPASVVHVGLPYTCDLQTLPSTITLQDASYGVTHRKNVKRVTLRVKDSSSIFAGKTFDSLYEYPARMNEYAGSIPDGHTGEVSIPVSAGWTDGGQVCVRQGNPLPLTVVSLTTEYEIV